MTRPTPRPVRATAALVLSATLLLTGCGSGSSSPRSSPAGSGRATTDGGQSRSGTPSSSLPVPAGVTVTPEGTSLRLGHGATVAWQPDHRTVGVIRLTVTRQQRVPISAFRDFRLDRATRRSTPYFVHVTVKNLGTSDLGGVPVPLYLLDHRHTLLQASTFQARFPACPSRPLPGGFRHGSHAAVCLVYFAPNHGRLLAMSFRPSQDYEAITWHGPVQQKATTH